MVRPAAPALNVPPDSTPVQKCCGKRHWERVPMPVVNELRKKARRCASTEEAKHFLQTVVYKAADQPDLFGDLGGGNNPCCRNLLKQIVGASNYLLGTVRETPKSGPGAGVATM
jgi:hypothetical protein